MSRLGQKPLLPDGDGGMCLQVKLRIIRLLLQVYKDYRRWADMEHRNKAKSFCCKISLCFSMAAAWKTPA